MQKTSKLADAFNESLLTPTKSSTKTTTNLHNIASEEQQDQEMTPNNSTQSAFYESDEWETFVDNSLATVTVPQSSPLRLNTQQQGNLIDTIIDRCDTFLDMHRNGVVLSVH